MNIKYFIFFCWVYVPVLMSGQSLNQHGFSLAFYGENFTRPGISIGYEFPINYNEIKTRSTQGKLFLTKSRIILLNSTLKFYNHKDLHYGFVLMPELKRRTVFPSGFTLDNILGLGWHRSFLSHKTYIADGNGGFELVPFAGQHTISLKLALQFGFDLRKKHNLPYSFFMGSGFNFRYPHNSIILPGFGLDIGYTYHFNFQKKHSNEN